MGDAREHTGEPRVRLADVLERHKDEIVARWLALARELPKAGALDRPTLEDHIPQLVDRLAEVARDFEEGRAVHLPEMVPDIHALERLEIGYDLEEVGREFVLLRRVLLQLLGENAQLLVPGELQLLNDVVDHAVLRTVARYAEARQRTLVALDRLADAARGTGDLDTFLPRLLRVLLETTASVDSVAVLLREGDELRVRASVGVESPGFSLRVGEGFAGRIAQERQPMLLHSASADPLVKSPQIREAGVRALYGVPLVHAGEVVGVAHIGSRSAFDFSDDDRLLFRIMASRATSLLVQSQLVEQERRAREAAQATEARAVEAEHVLRAVFDATPVGIGIVDRELRYLRVNAALAAYTGIRAEQHLGRTVGDVLGERAAFVEPHLRRVLETGAPSLDQELAIPTRVGGWRHFIVNFFPVASGAGGSGIGVVAVEITGRKRLERERERRTAELEAVLQAIPDAVFVGDATAVRRANAAALRLMGAGSLDDLNRRLAACARSSAHFDSRTREPVAVEEQAFSRALRGEAAVREVEVRGPDGEELHLRTAAAPIRVGGEIVAAVAVTSDVTEALRAERHNRFLVRATDLLASTLDFRESLRALAKLAVAELADWCVVSIVDPAGGIERLAVEHASEETARRAAELLKAFPPHADAPAGAEHVLRTGEPELVPEVSEELIASYANGAEHLDAIRRLGLVSWMAVPLSARGRLLGALSFASAESGRHFDAGDLAFACEIGRRAALILDNARLYQEAREAVRARDEILSVASHDLRSPLTALQLQLHTLLRRARRADGVDPEALLGRLEQMDRQFARVNALLAELLDVSRIHAGRLRLEPEELDLVALARDVLTRLEDQFEEAGCATSLVGDERVVGTWDALRLDQVVSNLLTNAAKYGRGRPVEVTVRREGERVLLSVTDHGIGIAPEDLQRLFHRFERAVGTDQFKGTGLGLWIVRRIVEEHGGVVRVESEPGKGSTFTVELPLRAPEPAA